MAVYICCLQPKDQKSLHCWCGDFFFVVLLKSKDSALSFHIYLGASSKNINWAKKHILSYHFFFYFLFNLPLWHQSSLMSRKALFISNLHCKFWLQSGKGHLQSQTDSGLPFSFPSAVILDISERHAGRRTRFQMAPDPGQKYYSRFVY